MSVAATIARGLAAGFVGTAAMTGSELIEMRLTGRPPSTVPGQVGGRLLGVTPETDAGMRKLTHAVHWSHGTAMGAVRGVLSLAGLRGAGATAAFYAALWSGDAMLYRVLGIAPSPWRWRPRELATDLFHKGVYAVVTGITYERLLK